MVADYDYIDTYIDTFLEYITKSDHIIGHNISFDIRMLRQNCERIGKHHDWETVRTFCTMKNLTHLNITPGKKRAKLRHLYAYLFGKEFENAHDAMADIEATKDCFVELAKRGEIIL